MTKFALVTIESHDVSHAGLMQGLIDLCTLSSDSLFHPCVEHFLLCYEGETLEGQNLRQ